MRSEISTIVIGGLNTDIVALGAKKILQPGEHTYAEKLHIGPGGKSRNIAQMIATLSGRDHVAMIGRTAKDPYGLWKPPITSLHEVGVNTEFITTVSFEETLQYPGIALIPVDNKGSNQIYVIPGVNNDFSEKDIDNADPLFQTAAKNKGILISTLELPYKTALHAVKKANEAGIKVLFDPGGIDEGQDYKELLAQKIFLLKPNEHEAKTLTGVAVKDGESAKTAADKLLQTGVENVLITIGAQGGYFFNKDTKKHIPIPKVKETGKKDETGCGDQTIAAFAYALNEGKDVVEAATTAIRAGTLQFYKSGISPLTRGELEVNS